MPHLRLPAILILLLADPRAYAQSEAFPVSGDARLQHGRGVCVCDAETESVVVRLFRECVGLGVGAARLGERGAERHRLPARAWIT